MATFALIVRLDSAAFADNPSELADALRKVADQVDPLPDAAGAEIVDTNGNGCGSWVISGAAAG